MDPNFRTNAPQISDDGSDIIYEFDQIFSTEVYLSNRNLIFSSVVFTEQKNLKKELKKYSINQEFEKI